MTDYKFDFRFRRKLGRSGAPVSPGQGGNDFAVRRNFQKYKPYMAGSSRQMFWASLAITLSFILSQAYIVFTN